MGMMIGASLLGAGMGAGGAWLGSDAAQQKRNELKANLKKYLPDLDKNTSSYFADVSKYTPQAEQTSRDIALSDQQTLMALQEKALPGLGAARQSAASALFPLLSGNLPPSVLQAFQRSGAASSVGSGLGGSGMGFLNQALFGARGQLGAMSLGYGLLPGLLSTMPMPNSPTTGSFLSALLTPSQRTNEQLQIRGQNLGIAQALSGMPTGGDIWAQYLTHQGNMLEGAGMTGMAAGGGGSSGSGIDLSKGGPSSGMSLGGASGVSASQKAAMFSEAGL